MSMFSRESFSAFNDRVVRGLRLFGVKNPTAAAQKHEKAIRHAYRAMISSTAIARRIARKVKG